MSICNIPETVRRIKQSDYDRPLAVFAGNLRDTFNVVPANTVYTQKLIEERDKRFIGVFHCRMKKKEIINFLRESNDIQFK